MNNWIPIGKGLPEDKRNVLVTVFESEWKFDDVIYPSELKTCLGRVERNEDGSHTWEYYWDNTGDSLILEGNKHEANDIEDDGIGYTEVLAWMYLPEPYREGTNGAK